MYPRPGSWERLVGALKALVDPFVPHGAADGLVLVAPNHRNVKVEGCAWRSKLICAGLNHHLGELRYAYRFAYPPNWPMRASSCKPNRCAYRFATKDRAAPAEAR